MNPLYLLVLLGTGFALSFLVKSKKESGFINSEKIKEIENLNKLELEKIRNRKKEIIEEFGGKRKEIERKQTSLEEKSKKHEENIKLKSEQISLIIKDLSDKLEGEKNFIRATRAEKEQLFQGRKNTILEKLGTTEDLIKSELLEKINHNTLLLNETKLRKFEENLKEESEKIAKNHLIGVIQKYSAPTSVEKKSLLIPVVRDETRIKVLGPNLEFVNFIEKELDVEIIFNDMYNTIMISSFDLVNKHIARETILKLIKERSVNLEKLNKIYLETKTSTEKLLIDIGKKIVKELKLEKRSFNNDFLYLLGRLKFRTSYGQNILKHSFEVGYFTLMLGAELGLNMDVCKIGGFFHDIGKAIDQIDGRPHDILTKEIMEKHNFSYEETHAAWVHHDAIPQETAEAMLVKAGDAISAGRPGARQETIEKYIARITAMEEIANSYEGVHKVYIMSGGREVRVSVNPKQLSDENLGELATAIAEEIEGNVAYPGKVKINIIRRLQSSTTAKLKSKTEA